MRDDRYRGTSLSREVRKLCRMSERDADRLRPERLKEQAVEALVSDASREISADFIRELGSAPSLFRKSNLEKAARTGLEVDIARNVGEGSEPKDAIGDALRRRGENYSREQKCTLIADRHPNA